MRYLPRHPDYQKPKPTTSKLTCKFDYQKPQNPGTTPRRETKFDYQKTKRSTNKFTRNPDYTKHPDHTAFDYTKSK